MTYELGDWIAFFILMQAMGLATGLILSVLKDWVNFN